MTRIGSDDSAHATVMICTQCQHPLRMHGNDYICTNSCRCVMIGCIPQTTKYDTIKITEE